MHTHFAEYLQHVTGETHAGYVVNLVPKMYGAGVGLGKRTQT